MSKKARIIVFSLAGLVILVLITSPRIRIFEASEEAESGPAGGALPITAYLVTPNKVTDKIRTTGSLLANEEVDLRSEVSGKLKRIMFKEGTPVHKGQPLLKIDDSELQAQLSKLKSQLGLAEDIEKRRKQLYENQNISPEDYERSLNELNSIKADIKLFEARIEKTEIKAPFDGVVGLRYVSEGSLVSPSTRIALLQDVSTIKIEFSVPEKYSNTVHVNDEIRFTREGTDKVYRGTVYAIEPKIDPVTRTLLVRARAPNAEVDLMPGSFAEVELSLSAVNDALMIPTEALVPELQGHKVFLVKNGAVEPSPVEIGIRTGTQIQVTSGIVAGDTVITSGILQVQPGMPVEVTRLDKGMTSEL